MRIYAPSDAPRAAPDERVKNEIIKNMLTLDKSAERCGITHGTAFTWRHKILDAVGKGVENDGLSGIVEADEAFMPVSYKGDKAAFEKDEVGRAPRKRGGENHKRGLSDELLCVPLTGKGML